MSKRRAKKTDVVKNYGLGRWSNDLSKNRKNETIQTRSKAPVVKTRGRVK